MISQTHRRKQNGLRPSGACGRAWPPTNSTPSATRVTERGHPVDATPVNSFGSINCLRHPYAGQAIYACRHLTTGDYHLPASSVISVEYAGRGVVIGRGNYIVAVNGAYYQGCSYSEGPPSGVAAPGPQTEHSSSDTRPTQMSGYCRP